MPYNDDDVDVDALQAKYDDQPFPYRDEDILRELYWEKELRPKTIGTILGTNDRQIRKWMKKNDIPLRNQGGDIAFGHFETPYRDEDTLRKLHHDQRMNLGEIADHFDCDITTIRRWVDNHSIERRYYGNAKGNDAQRKTSA